MFHPLSDAHVVVLCSSCVRLYDLRAIGEAVLDVSLDDGPGSTSPAVACAFGALRGCERFALFVAREDGEVAVVCPFVPSGTAVRMAEWQVLVDDALAELDAVGDDDAEGAAHLERHAEWLQGHAWKTLCDSGAAAGAGEGVDDAGFGWKVYQVEMDKLSCELPVATQPMDVQPMVQTASGGGLRSIATVPALVTSVTVIVRLHATGRADVLASVDPVETRWSADEHVAPVQWTQLYTTELGFPVPYRGPAPCLEVDPVAGHLVYAASPTSVYVTLGSTVPRSYLRRLTRPVVCLQGWYGLGLAVWPRRRCRGAGRRRWRHHCHAGTDDSPASVPGGHTRRIRRWRASSVGRSAWTLASRAPGSCFTRAHGISGLSCIPDVWCGGRVLGGGYVASSNRAPAQCSASTRCTLTTCFSLQPTARQS